MYCENEEKNENSSGTGQHKKPKFEENSYQVHVIVIVIVIVIINNIIIIIIIIK